MFAKIVKEPFLIGASTVKCLTPFCRAKGGITKQYNHSTIKPFGALVTPFEHHFLVHVLAVSFY